MQPYEKPLPLIDNDTRFFWEKCKENKLMIQKCTACSQYIFYPRNICPHCMSDEIEWVESSGKGTLYSYTIAHRAGGPGYQEDVPYIVALIELDEGVRLMSTVVNCERSELACDLRVEVVFERVTDEITLPKFQLSK